MSEAVFYPEGEIEARLARSALHTASGPAADPADPYRQAASVLAAIDLEKLRPVDGEGTPPGPLSLFKDTVPSPYLEAREQFPRTLRADVRRATLAGMRSGDALQRALQANPHRPPTLLQEILTAAIEGTRFVPSEMTADQLGALAIVSGWLAGAELPVPLPTAALVLDEIERQRDRQTLERLASGHFTGRDDELAALRTHLESRDPQVLCVSGPGGIGKSALLARLLLEKEDRDRTSLPTWVRVDLDHPLVSPSEPLTILREAANQLARRHPTMKSYFLRLIAEMGRSSQRRDTVRFESVSDFDHEDYQIQRLLKEFFWIVELTPNTDQPFVFCIDTVEEAQFLGEDAVDRLLDFAFALAESMPTVRVILSGRTPVRHSRRSVPRVPTVLLELGELPSSAAHELLTRIVREIAVVPSPLPPPLYEAAVRVLGGNPLTLHLAAPLLLREGADGVLKLVKVKTDTMQQWLYSRVLQHLRNPELEKLAEPGLTLRRLTSGAIREVLAGPCQLGPITPDEAGALLEEMAFEVTLVERRPDGSLRHRQDVRQLMLAARSEDDPTVRLIDEAAVAYWARQPEIDARAEEIYHRLRLSQPAEELDRHWQPAAAPLLGNALDEFPVGSSQRVWLAQKLAVVLQQSELAVLAQPEWEQQVSSQALQLLAEGRAGQALEALSQRTERLPGSPVFAVEARVHLLLGDLDRAAEVTLAGLRNAHEGESFKRMPDLALLLATIHERQGDLLAALGIAKLACEWANVTFDKLDRLSAGVRHLRLCRLTGTASDGSEVSLISRLAEELGQNALVSQPGLLRELAGELGRENRYLLRAASKTLLEEILQPMDNNALVALLRDARLVIHSEELSLLFADPSELRRLASNRIEEELYSGREGPLVDRLCELFRDGTDRVIRGEPSKLTPVDPTPAVTLHTPETLDPRALRELVELIDTLPRDEVQRVARFRTRTDLAELGDHLGHGDAVVEMVNRAVRIGQLPELFRDLEASASAQGLRYLLKDLESRLVRDAPPTTEGGAAQEMTGGA